MPQLLPLYFEVREKILVFSETDPTPYTLPTLHQEDTLTIKIIAVQRQSLFETPLLQQISLAGFAAYVGIGSANSPLAAQATFTTATDDPDALVGDLDLNTAGINALADGATSTFELRLTGPTTARYRGQFTVTIKKSVALSGALSVIAGDTALGTLEARRTYVAKEGSAGDSVILTSPLGLKIRLAAMDDGAGGVYLDSSPIT